MIDTAMLFAAGYGTRMLSLTKNTPKPLIKVAGKPLIDYILDRLVQSGIKKIIINTHHFAEQMEEYLKERNDAEIIFSREDNLLETGGGLVKALPLLGEAPFLVANSDVILLESGTPVINRLLEAWNPVKMDILLLLHPRNKAIGYKGDGDFELTATNNVVRPDQLPRTHVFAGVHIVNPILLKELKEEPFSLAQLWFKSINDSELLKRVYGMEHQGEWLHVGTPDELKEAENFLRKYSNIECPENITEKLHKK